MSKKILYGTLDTINLLIFLSSFGEKYTTSSKLREKFPDIKRHTLDMKLKKLKEQKLVEWLIKKPQIAGADKREYRLTKEGVKVCNDLIELNFKILEPVINKMVQSDLKSSKLNEEIINNILMEFSEESTDMVTKEILEEQVKLLRKSLEKLL